MKQVSEAYKESMAAPIRNRSHVRVIFDNFDTTIPSDGEWASNGELGMSDFSTVDFERVYTAKYATFEHNRWVLDGSFDIAPDEGAVTGFVSSVISNEYGDTITPAILTRSFTTPHTIPGLTLIFDTRTHERPRNITVNFYLAGEMIKHEKITVEGDFVSVLTDIEACDKISIVFGTMPPYRFPRLEAVGYGIQKEFVNNDIVSTRQAHDVDPLSRRAPKETMQFTILDFARQYDPDNPSGVWKYIAEKAKASIQFGYEVNGNVEWVKPDSYVLDSRPTFSQNMATFNATGMTGRMSGTYYKSRLGEKNFYDMALDVLQDAGLPPRPDGSDPWEIDESLKTMKTTAALPIDTHANCLQLIAHACRCKLYTDDDNVIHIAPLVLSDLAPGDFLLDFTSITQNSQAASKIDRLKSVMISVYSYASKVRETIYEGTTDDMQIHVEFSGPVADDATISVEGGSVVSSQIYARAADIVLTEGTKTITISGRPLTENAVVYTYPVDTAGSVNEEKNPLITSPEMAMALANHVAAYLKLRNTYDVSYRGNPELECGDVIGLQTTYAQRLNGLVLTDEITFNGSLKGKVKVKML